MTPSERDLKLTANPTGLIRNGNTATFNCTAPRVKPPPKEMYLKFTDYDQIFHGQIMTSTNSDGLTSYVTLEYTMTMNKNMNGQKLMCYYVTQDGNVISSSEDITVTVLCEYFFLKMTLLSLFFTRQNLVQALFNLLHQVAKRKLEKNILK